ncbi:hypothetical protein ACT4MK_22375 [Bradyrhizobium barranii]|uniref:hypothetical protein n=1 Tax=Bradyrhizobium barranii TaxID=2992140 RepID=UPI004034032F
MTIESDGIDLMETSLMRLMLMLLEHALCTPEELERDGLHIDEIPETPISISILQGVRQIEGRIKTSYDEATYEAITKRAIARARQAFISENDVGRAQKNTVLMSIGALITRRQFAVGHGGFHASSIKVLCDPTGQATRDALRSCAGLNTLLDLAYVYDCGSEHPSAFAKALKVYRETIAERLEILFVSHLHADHINGLDRLLGNKVPDIVVLPYLDFEDIAAIALSDFEGSKFSGSYRAYLRDPVAWWTGRGVRTVIFIEPDDGGGDSLDLPIRPIEGSADSSAGDFDHPQARLVAALRKPAGHVPSELKAADGTAVGVRELTGPCLLAGSGSHFRLEWRYDPKDSWRQADWYLIPYVHPVRDAQRTEFRAEIQQRLKLQDVSPAEFRARILDELTCSKKAKVLVDIYINHFSPSDHNAVSMSLYSGPASSRQQSEVVENWTTEWQFSPRSESALENGWLSTGDSMLRQPKRRKPWHQFYSEIGKPIAALTLPHHGSNHNFHDEILAWENLRLALVTTVPDDERVAQIGKTLESVVAQEKLGLVIDDRSNSEVSCLSSRFFTSNNTAWRT